MMAKVLPVPWLKGAKKRKDRPYEPGDPNSPFIDCLLPKCGSGSGTQIDTGITLLNLAPEGTNIYDSELSSLSNKINSLFKQEAQRLLSRKQEEVGNKYVQITLALYRGGLYLTYAIPVDKMSPETKKYWFKKHPRKKQKR